MSPKRAGRNQVLVELVRMRKEIERLINTLTGDDNREFVKNLNNTHLFMCTKIDREFFN